MKTYPDLLKKHGVDIGTAYNNEIQCGTFIAYIGQNLKNKVNKDLLRANYITSFVTVQQTVAYSKN